MPKRFLGLVSCPQARASCVPAAEVDHPSPGQHRGQPACGEGGGTDRGGGQVWSRDVPEPQLPVGVAASCLILLWVPPGAKSLRVKSPLPLGQEIGGNSPGSLGMPGLEGLQGSGWLSVPPRCLFASTVLGGWVPLMTTPPLLLPLMAALRGAGVAVTWPRPHSLACLVPREGCWSSPRSGWALFCWGSRPEKRPL